LQVHARAPDEAALARAREGAEAHKDALLAASKAAEALVARMDKVAMVQVGCWLLGSFYVASSSL
jgi:hypothetical protein